MINLDSITEVAGARAEMSLADPMHSQDSRSIDQGQPGIRRAVRAVAAIRRVRRRQEQSLCRTPVAGPVMQGMAPKYS